MSAADNEWQHQQAGGEKHPHSTYTVDGASSDTGTNKPVSGQGRSKQQRSGAISQHSPPSTPPAPSNEPLLPDSDSKPARPGYAQELKKSLSSHGPAPSTTPRKRAPEHDPENYEIKRMRVEESMTWADIARILNDRRIANGQSPSLTEAAVYGRFVRNGPRIAAAQGVDFNPSDYMKLRNAKAMPEGEMPPSMEVERFSAAQDTFLVEAHHEVQKSFWETVAERLHEKSGKRFTAEQCAKRYQHL